MPSTRELHVAIIMDGNGRWATRRGLPRLAGHRAGLKAARRVVEAADEAKIACLTLYAFSSSNWKRPPAEVSNIFWLLRAFLRLEAHRLSERGVQLQVIGRRDRLPRATLAAIEEAEQKTHSGGGLRLRVAIDYSARESILQAAVTARSATDLERAFTGDAGDVDLLIRTGGEQRLSDFLLWESAFAELVFTSALWPDFSEADFHWACTEFHQRDRRFGAVPATAA
jgi:undecaprenyl diphosphate synthase